MSAEKRLAELGITLPAAPAPKGNYRPIVIVDRMAYLAGHLPIDVEGDLATGRVGTTTDVETATAAARTAGLSILATLRGEIGSLDRVERVIRVMGFVACKFEFQGQPAVINGCSDLLVEIFGPDAGVGVRAAVGTNTLPLGAVVEIEAQFLIRAE